MYHLKKKQPVIYHTGCFLLTIMRKPISYNQLPISCYPW